MAQVLIRNLDDAVVADLKRQAAEAGASLEQFLRDLLTEKTDKQARRDQVFAELRALREQMGPRKSDLDPAEMIREDRDNDHGHDWFGDLSGR